MLEKIDLKKRFCAAQGTSPLQASFYAEQREGHTIEYVGRQQRARVQFEEGSRFEVQGETSRKIITEETLPVTPVVRGTSHLQNLVSNRNKLDQLLRKAPFDLDAQPPPSLRYSEMKRRFLTATGPENAQIDEDSYAEIEAHFQIGARAITISRCRQSAAAFWEDVEKDPLFLDPGLRKGWENPWPAPQGKLPVLWSSEATSKLLLPFLRLFEEGRVSKRLSLLSEWASPLPLKFELEDRPKTDFGKVDQAGAIRSHRKLIERGMPAGLTLGSKTTGFTRRMHYLGECAQGFWNISLLSDLRQEKISNELQMGVFVGDLKVDAFNTRTAEIVLTLSNACLVHHGELGEAILPVTLKCSLMDLFASWEIFSKTERTFGYWLTKEACRFITEITAPEAFSREFFIPGTVSPSHYW